MPSTRSLLLLIALAVVLLLGACVAHYVDDLADRFREQQRSHVATLRMGGVEVTDGREAKVWRSVHAADAADVRAVAA